MNRKRQEEPAQESFLTDILLPTAFTFLILFCLLEVGWMIFHLDPLMPSAQFGGAFLNH